MCTVNYPLLYYPPQKEAVLGILVGADYQMVDVDLKRLKISLTEYLNRQYKKEDIYPYMDILEPKLKIMIRQAGEIETQFLPLINEVGNRWVKNYLLISNLCSFEQ